MAEKQKEKNEINGSIENGGRFKTVSKVLCVFVVVVVVVVVVAYSRLLFPLIVE